jgi:hypothetical protein
MDTNVAAAAEIEKMPTVESDFCDADQALRNLLENFQERGFWSAAAIVCKTIGDLEHAITAYVNARSG